MSAAAVAIKELETRLDTGSDTGGLTVLANVGLAAFGETEPVSLMGETSDLAARKSAEDSGSQKGKETGQAGAALERITSAVSPGDGAGPSDGAAVADSLKGATPSWALEGSEGTVRKAVVFLGGFASAM